MNPCFILLDIQASRFLLVYASIFFPLALKKSVPILILKCITQQLDMPLLPADSSESLVIDSHANLSDGVPNHKHGRSSHGGIGGLSRGGGERTALRTDSADSDDEEVVVFSRSQIRAGGGGDEGGGGGVEGAGGPGPGGTGEVKDAGRRKAVARGGGRAREAGWV